MIACPNEHLWAVVLAAGEGTRLASLTRARSDWGSPRRVFSSLAGRPELGHLIARIASEPTPVVAARADTSAHVLVA